MKRSDGAVSVAMILGVLVAVVATVVVGTVATAITFDPTLDASVSDPAAGARADITTEFGIPEPDANYAVQATFTPPEFTVAGSNDIPLGAIVGKLDSVATLGLANQACNTAFPVHFDSTLAGAPPGSGLLNASVNTADTVTWIQQFDDTNGNSLPDGVDKYPDFLTRIFPGLTPRARYYGQAVVGGKPVSLNFVVFSPGVTLPGLGALDPALGYPAVSVLDNNGDPEAVRAPSAISDNCTPLTSTTVNYGVSKDNAATAVDESGAIVRANPLAVGSYTFTSRAISQPDADDDDIENQLDTCPYVENVGDPTVAGSGDQDGDGIDDACDPTPTEATNGTDHDGDGYVNRLDNCPLVANGLATTNQADADVDGIGNACDQNPNTPDGTVLDRTDTATVLITRPANDDFADAQIMPPMGDEQGTFSATVEAGEPRPCGSIGATVWYRWVPSVSDRWQASTIGSDFNTVLAVYTGMSLATLNLIGCSDNASYLRSVVTFDAVAGQTYYFQVGGPAGETGLLHFGLGNTCAPLIPGTYNGTVTINGSPAPDGTLVRASIQGWECATDTTSGGRYVLACPSGIPVDPPCFRPGWVSFEAGGTACVPTVEFGNGLQDVDLQCPAANTEGDGFTDAREIYLGTDPLDACPDVLGTPGLCPGPSCDGDDAWPLDMNVDTFSTVAGDVFYFRGRIGETGGPPPSANWWVRLDFNMDNFLTVAGDVFMYRGRIGETCE